MLPGWDQIVRLIKLPSRKLIVRLSFLLRSLIRFSVSSHLFSTLREELAGLLAVLFVDATLLSNRKRIIHETDSTLPATRIALTQAGGVGKMMMGMGSPASCMPQLFYHKSYRYFSINLGQGTSGFHSTRPPNHITKQRGIPSFIRQVA